MAKNTARIGTHRTRSETIKRGLMPVLVAVVTPAELLDDAPVISKAVVGPVESTLELSDSAEVVSVTTSRPDRVVLTPVVARTRAHSSSVLSQIIQEV